MLLKNTLIPTISMEYELIFEHEPLVGPHITHRISAAFDAQLYQMLREHKAA